VYFGICAATSALLTFCIAAAILPGPARGYPTFRDKAELALETSGLPVFIPGFIGGVTYWFLSERNRKAKT
jgi:uncharacterized RDD family membrane protein YckC